MKLAAMLWTGGKDSALALDEAVRDGYHVGCLATFAPPNPTFRAHPLAFMARQARALGLPHHVLTVTGSFEAGYEAGLRRLRDERGIECVVTGDIAEIDGRPNWIRERCRAVGIGVYMPLWQRDRGSLLRAFLDRGFSARISCVDTRRLDRGWVGRELDERAVAELRGLHEQCGLDPSGEQGEYHTMTTRSPEFDRAIEIGDWSVEIEGELAYMAFAEPHQARAAAPER